MSIRNTGILDISESFSLPTTGSLSLWVIPLDDNSIYNSSGLICEFGDGVSTLILGNSGDNYYITANISGIKSSIYFPDSGGLSHCSLYWNNDNQTGIFYLNNNINVISDFTIPTGIIPTGYFYPTSGLSEVGLWSTDISNHQQELYNQFNNTHFEPSKTELYYPLGGIYGNNLNDYSKNKRNLYARENLCCDLYLLEISGINNNETFDNCNNVYSQCLELECNSFNGSFLITSVNGNNSSGNYYIDFGNYRNGSDTLEIFFPGVTKVDYSQNSNPTYQIIENGSGYYCTPIQYNNSCLVDSKLFNDIAYGWWYEGFYISVDMTLVEYKLLYEETHVNNVIQINLSDGTNTVIYQTNNISCVDLFNGITLNAAVPAQLCNGYVCFPSSINIKLYTNLSKYRFVFNSAGVLTSIEILDISYICIGIFGVQQYDNISKVWENTLKTCDNSNEDTSFTNVGLGNIGCSNITLSKVDCSGSLKSPWTNKHLPQHLKYLS